MNKKLITLVLAGIISIGGATCLGTNTIFANNSETATEDNDLTTNEDTNIVQREIKDFRWYDDNNKIVPKGHGTTFGQGVFGINFKNDKGETFIPYASEIFESIECKLTILDEYGKEKETLLLDDISNDNNVEFYLSGDGEPYNLVVWVNDINKLSSDNMILKVTDKDTHKSISKQIHLDRNQKIKK